MDFSSAYSRSLFGTRGEVHFFAKHDDRQGHHYYTRWLHRPTQTYIVVMTLAVIMGGGILQKNETHPEKELGVAKSSSLVYSGRSLSATGQALQQFPTNC